MTINKNADLIRKMKELRPFVSFNYDLRKPIHPNSARKIEKYWGELQDIKSVPVKIFRSKNKKNMATARKASSLQLSGFKVAAIPDPSEDIKLIFKNDRLILKSKNSDKVFYPFNQKNLAEDTEGEIDFVLDQVIEETIIIYTGRYMYRRADDKEYIRETLLRLIYSYANYSEFLLGVYGINIKGQTSIPDELRKEKNFINLQNETRRKRKRQNKYAKAKGR